MALLKKPPKQHKKFRLGVWEKEKDAADLYISLKGINKKEKAIRSDRSVRRQDRVKGLKGMMIMIPILMVIILAGGIWIAYQEFVKLNPPVYPTASDYEPPSSLLEEDSTVIKEKDQHLLRPVGLNNPLTQDYKVDLAEYGGVPCDAVIVPSLTRMMQDAQSAGYTLHITQGYIDASQQQQLYDTEVNRLMTEKGYTKVKAENEAEKTVPPAGSNEYQTGLNVSFSTEETTDFAASGAYKWLVSHCVEYGFVLRYPEAMEKKTDHDFDPAQFRYVGEEHAKKMRTLNMCLEEYYAYMIG